MDEQQAPHVGQERPGRAAKPRKRCKSSKPEMLSRNVEISSFGATVRIGAVHRKGEEPEIDSQPWLELRGTRSRPCTPTITKPIFD
jgi:hypothetical protein